MRLRGRTLYFTLHAVLTVLVSAGCSSNASTGTPSCPAEAYTLDGPLRFAGPLALERDEQGDLLFWSNLDTLGPPEEIGIFVARPGSPAVHLVEKVDVGGLAVTPV